MIDLENVSFSYGFKPLLQEVNLHVPRGELLAVMGPNGMGKSTLLRVMAGVIPALEGTVRIDGIARASSEEEECAIRSRVVYHPAEPFLPALATPREILFTMGRVYGVGEAGLARHVEQILGIFDLVDKADERVGRLSTGQKKKTALAGALASEAPILILDEPFSGGLDNTALQAMSRILKRLAENRDITVVMAVPVPELVEHLADRIAVLDHGRLQACGTLDELRAETGCEGDLPTVLAQLGNPDGVRQLAAYLEERA